MGAELAGALAQFGTAGLIGWMWLTERRASAERERELREAHEALVRERAQLGELMRVVSANTAALAALEAGQRELRGLLRRRMGVRGVCEGGVHSG